MHIPTIWTYGRQDALGGISTTEPVPHYDTSSPPKKNQLFTGLRTDLFIVLRQPKTNQVESLHLSQLQEKPTIINKSKLSFICKIHNVMIISRRGVGE
jgi:hypothetical protein